MAEGREQSRRPGYNPAFALVAGFAAGLQPGLRDYEIEISHHPLNFTKNPKIFFVSLLPKTVKIGFHKHRDG